jgi:hypothetical protein
MNSTSPALVILAASVLIVFLMPLSRLTTQKTGMVFRKALFSWIWELSQLNGDNLLEGKI